MIIYCRLRSLSTSVIQDKPPHQVTNTTIDFNGHVFLQNMPIISKVNYLAFSFAVYYYSRIQHASYDNADGQLQIITVIFLSKNLKRQCSEYSQNYWCTYQTSFFAF